MSQWVRFAKLHLSAVLTTFRLEKKCPRLPISTAASIWRGLYCQFRTELVELRPVLRYSVSCYFCHFCMLQVIHNVFWWFGFIGSFPLFENAMLLFSRNNVEGHMDSRVDIKQIHQSETYKWKQSDHSIIYMIYIFLHTMRLGGYIEFRQIIKRPEVTLEVLFSPF